MHKDPLARVLRRLRLRSGLRKLCNGTGEIEDEDDIFSVGDKFKYLGLDAIVTNVEFSIYSGITYTIFIECSGVTLSVNSLSETLKNI